MGKSPTNVQNVLLNCSRLVLWIRSPQHALPPPVHPSCARASSASGSSAASCRQWPYCGGTTSLPVAAGLFPAAMLAHEIGVPAARVLAGPRLVSSPPPAQDKAFKDRVMVILLWHKTDACLHRQQYNYERSWCLRQVEKQFLLENPSIKICIVQFASWTKLV